MVRLIWASLNDVKVTEFYAAVLALIFFAVDFKSTGGILIIVQVYLG
ncbi:MAG: hypothetical protein ACOH2D_17655 [Gelidibacter sp.]